MTSAGRKLPTFTSLTSSSLSADPDDEDAARARQRGERLAALGEDVVEQRRRASEMRALDDQDRQRREARRPGPSEAASAIDAKPSSSAFVASAS